MVNKVTLIGRVGKDAVVKHFDNGGVIAEFSLATDDSYKKKDGEKVEQTDWHNCKVTYGKLAEVAEKYVKKGMLLYVEGKIKTRSYDDKDGNKRYATEIVCDTFKMLSSKNDTGVTESTDKPVGERGSGSGTTERGGITSAADDDLPFILLALFSIGSLMQYAVL